MCAGEPPDIVSLHLTGGSCFAFLLLLFTAVIATTASIISRYSKYLAEIKIRNEKYLEHVWKVETSRVIVHTPFEIVPGLQLW